MTSAALIERLARLRGIGEAYHDYRGELRHFTLETKTALLRAMHVDTDDVAAVQAAIREAESEHWSRLAASVLVVRPGQASVAIVTAAEVDWITLTYRISCEGGESRSGGARVGALPEIERAHIDGQLQIRRKLELPADLPHGYHEIEMRVGDHAPVVSRLIAAPATCYQPPALAAGKRWWGLVAQLYTVRSATNWGYGDFADLEALVRLAAARGAAFVGLNPLHALFPADPGNASPYSASSRRALNVLYIAPYVVPEFSTSSAVRSLVNGAAFRARLDAARASTQVDYVTVAGLKFEVFELLFAEFQREQLARNTARALAFRAFVLQGGAALRLHATFDAIDEHLRGTLGTPAGWQNWPQEYRHPHAAAVRDFQAEHAERIEFYAYLQWLATDQLSASQALARKLGMQIGLYCDYAVGVNSSGSETWSDQVVYCMGAAIGAPPDPLALKGQDWGIPPQDPAGLARAQFAPFIGLVRASLNSCGALRLDHVMALFRQWWVPRGLSSTAGGYVHYPLDVLLSILALESERAQALIVGEDLGTVPDEMRRAMQQYAIYHYKVMFFEKEGDGFRPPANYERRALATVTTHDLPTLRAWWQGDDIDMRERLQLYPSAEAAAKVKLDRALDRQRLLSALQAAALTLPLPDETTAPYSDEFAVAAHAFLAKSAAALVAVQLEDLIGMVEPINVPGTSNEYPNWQRKMAQPLEEIFAAPGAQAVLAAVALARSS